MPLTLLLRCDDLEATRAHYRDVLGFTTSDPAQGILTVAKEDCTLIFTPDDLWKSPPVFSGTVYFAIADVDGYFDAVKNKATIAWPLQDMDYGTREFGVRDCNGYHLAFRRKA
ncbi:bleomycin resistance family protein [Variovorax sp. J22R133]|uniref:VOC family protein n=1 Tax=Variovorax brevis TaxID=3053503 RepID=UPI002574EB0B|nr:VOC family protein [Variovorax sp. J22R133]MDM0115129.1 bleomycin resistance family protein [Variovorax sp. J22R133]